jgi:hypothetical protein
MNRFSSGGGAARQWAGIGCLLLLVGAIGLAGWATLRVARPATLAAATPTLPPTATQPPPGPRPTVTAAFPPVPATVDGRPPPAQAALDYARLFTTTVPALDYLAAAQELGGAPPAPPAGGAPAYGVGDRVTFQTADGPREAELLYLDELAAYWAESGLALDQAALAAAAGRLRERYYPLLSATFGQEARPGIDGDPRFHVLHVLGPPDAFELGYFSDEDEYPRTLFAASNEREMVYLNMSQLTVGEPLYDGTLVHEVQHLIQWNLDANEDTWLNEGLSQVAETLAGLDTVAPDAYLEQPYVRLDGWSDEEPDVFAHYAGSYLYALYLWEQAGDAALRELARHPANGLAAVRAVLAGYRPDLTLEQFSGDWASALYLDGASDDPRYTIARAGDLGLPFLSNRARQLPFETTAALDPFAIDYVDLDLSGPVIITFAGDATAALIDAPPPTGDAFWFAPPANSSRAQLTAAVDLSELDAARLEFAVWHDLEVGYDFAYLSISVDGGQTWQRLSPARPTAGSYGAAWGGASGGWQRESVGLAAYAGRPALLRFDVVTDVAGVGQGFALSELTVAGAAVQPVWQPDGFVATGRLLPQRWEVRLIREGQMPEVTPLALDGSNRGQLAVDLGPQGGALVIMPVTPFAATPADYWLRVSR